LPICALIEKRRIARISLHVSHINTLHLALLSLILKLLYIVIHCIKIQGLEDAIRGSEAEHGPHKAETATVSSHISGLTLVTPEEDT
jgi:hypothetical protein